VVSVKQLLFLISCFSLLFKKKCTFLFQTAVFSNTCSDPHFFKESVLHVSFVNL